MEYKYGLHSPLGFIWVLYLLQLYNSEHYTYINIKNVHHCMVTNCYLLNVDSFDALRSGKYSAIMLSDDNCLKCS